MLQISSENTSNFWTREQARKTLVAYQLAAGRIACDACSTITMERINRATLSRHDRSANDSCSYTQHGNSSLQSEKKQRQGAVVAVVCVREQYINSHCIATLLAK